jgi:hypothetical protein
MADNTEHRLGLLGSFERRDTGEIIGKDPTAEQGAFADIVPPTTSGQQGNTEGILDRNVNTVNTAKAKFE